VGGSLRKNNAEYEGIQDAPCWKLGGYSMYRTSQSGHLLAANNDVSYINALEESSFGYLRFVFGFSRQEYPPQTKTGALTF